MIRWHKVNRNKVWNEYIDDLPKYHDFLDTFGFDLTDDWTMVYDTKKMLDGRTGYNNGMENKELHNMHIDSDYWIDHGAYYKIKGTNKIIMVGHCYLEHDKMIRNARKYANKLGICACVGQKENDWHIPHTPTVFYMSQKTLDWFKDKYKYDLKIVVDNPKQK